MRQLRPDGRERGWGLGGLPVGKVGEGRRRQIGGLSCGDSSMVAGKGPWEKQLKFLLRGQLDMWE